MTATAVQNRQPWDQRPGETAAAYARFLIYRNLGLTRTVQAAYKVYLNSKKVQQSPPQSRSAASPQFKAESQTMNWQARAEAWDIAVLWMAGERSVAAVVTLIEEMALRALRRLADEKVGPKDWGQLLRTLEILATYVPRDALGQDPGGQPGAPSVTDERRG
jgi:hypothetical protein